jgi:hypothetical protein
MATATEEKTQKASAPVAEAAPSGPPPRAPRGSAGGGWKAKLVAGLQEKPNEWVVLKDVSPSVVSHLKKIEVTGGALEVSSHNSRFVEGRKTRVSDVYARFVPAGTAAPKAPKNA